MGIMPLTTLMELQVIIEMEGMTETEEEVVIIIRGARWTLQNTSLWQNHMIPRKIRMHKIQERETTVTMAQTITQRVEGT